MKDSIFVAASLCIALLPAVYADPAAKPKESFPAQATVAAKKPFLTIAATDPSVKNALDAKDLGGAGKQIGKMGAFQGKVAKAYSPGDHDIVILDFAPNYRAAVTAVIKPDTYAKMPDLQSLVGKRVLITGQWKAFHNAPQIELSSPTQIKVIR